MSIRVNRTFRVRSYEIGPAGTVHNAVVLNWCQEAAFDGSSALGYPPAAYQALGAFWILRNMDVELVNPIHFNEQVTVTTWLSEFRRVRCWREYELSVAGTGTPVARARAEWVFLDQANGAIRRIPSELIAVADPDGQPALLPFDWPAAPDHPQHVFAAQRQVQRYELDELNHVNNAVYHNWIEHHAYDAWDAWGHDPATLHFQRHFLDYQRSALLGDHLTVSIATKPHNQSLIWYHTIHRADTLLISARSLSNLPT
jgi:acyl-CoA thioester hydrolase